MTADERNPIDDGLEGLDDVGHLSGYDEADQYLATRFRQGGRDVYCIDLSVPQLVNTLNRPNPDQTLDANRRINLPHAKSFAAYVRANENWIIPPLLLRASNDIFTFQPRNSIGGTEWGVLTLPREARPRLKIIDGQHRVLGFHLAHDDLIEEKDAARGKLHTLERRGDKAEKRQQGKQVARISTELQRLGKERVAVQIVVVDAEEEYKQMFVDIANNAKGITQTVRARFDSRHVVNRCLDSVMEHRLLKDRVDIERDNVSGSTNPNLTSVKSVADIVRTLQVGIAGRITRQREDTLEASKMIDDAMLFLDTLVEGFPLFMAIADTGFTPQELRRQSLLASVSMQRVLAGVYYDLLTASQTNLVYPPRDPDDPDKIRVPRPRSRAEVVRFFQSLAPFMAAPLREDSIWVREAPQQFAPDTSAPRATSRDLRELTTTIRNWAIEPPEWLRPTVRGMAT